ncbi:MAG: toll/interleukin-1 receptor domain-containing protein, partial [Litorimonas sp.]
MTVGPSDVETSADTTVFFSYSRKDRDRALPIIRAIEDAGYSVWWDGMLEGGTRYLETTEQALESAQAVVVLWSRESVGSDWVRDEATSGRERGRIVPLSLDGSMAPLGFRQVQHIDMRGWHAKPQVFDEVERCLAKLHDREYAPVDRRDA